MNRTYKTAAAVVTALTLGLTLTAGSVARAAGTDEGKDSQQSRDVPPGTPGDMHGMMGIQQGSMSDMRCPMMGSGQQQSIMGGPQGMMGGMQHGMHRHAPDTDSAPPAKGNQ